MDRYIDKYKEDFVRVVSDTLLVIVPHNMERLNIRSKEFWEDVADELYDELYSEGLFG